MRKYHIAPSLYDRWTNLPRNILYFCPTPGEEGIQPSQSAQKQDSTKISNLAIIEEFRKILSEEYVYCRYQNVTVELRNHGDIVNHKKVYCFMNDNRLLLGKAIRISGKRDFVKFLRINGIYSESIGGNVITLCYLYKSVQLIKG